MPIDSLRRARDARERVEREAEARAKIEEALALEREQKELAAMYDQIKVYLQLSTLEQLIADLYDAIGKKELLSKTKWQWCPMKLPVIIRALIFSYERCIEWNE